MARILEYIEEHNEGDMHCYRTKKLSLDDYNHDTISSENSDTDTELDSDLDTDKDSV